MCLELISFRDRILFLYLSCIFTYFSPFLTSTGKVPDRFLWRQLMNKLTAIYLSNFRHKMCLELISSRYGILFLYFSCIFSYISPFLTSTGKVPDRFSWRQFFYKLTAIYLSNLCHKICRELVSSRYRIIFPYFSCIFSYFCPFLTSTGKVLNRF